MPVRKLQVQPTYGTPTGRKYYRLRLPYRMISQYVKEHGEDRAVWVGSASTLCIGDKGGGRTPIHILGVKEMRDARYSRFWQVMIPSHLAEGMQGGDRVNVTRSGSTIRLKFGRNLFDVKTQAPIAQPA